VETALRNKIEELKNKVMERDLENMDREKDCYRENVEAYHRYAIKRLCVKLRETNRDKKEVEADLLSQIKELNNKLEDTRRKWNLPPVAK